MMGDMTGMIDKMDGVDAGEEDRGGINDVLRAVVHSIEPKNTIVSVWTRGRFSGRITVATKDADKVLGILNERRPISTSETSPEQKRWP